MMEDRFLKRLRKKARKGGCGRRVHPEIRQLGRADRRMLAPPLAPTKSSASVAKGSRQVKREGGTRPKKYDTLAA